MEERTIYPLFEQDCLYYIFPRVHQLTVVRAANGNVIEATALLDSCKIDMPDVDVLFTFPGASTDHIRRLIDTLVKWMSETRRVIEIVK